MAAINFMIGTCAIPLKSILALIRAKFWLIELLSGLLIPMTYFPEKARAVLAGCRSSISPTRRCKSISASWTTTSAARACDAVALGVGLLVLAHLWWNRASRRITIQGG